jgi:hypothetical protein
MNKTKIKILDPKIKQFDRYFTQNPTDSQFKNQKNTPHIKSFPPIKKTALKMIPTNITSQKTNFSFPN